MIYRCQDKTVPDVYCSAVVESYYLLYVSQTTCNNIMLKANLFKSQAVASGQA